MTYAGFWRRLGAGLVDFIVLLPLLLIYVKASSYSKTVTLILFVLATFSFSAYNIFFHARWGQTLGKMLFGIKVIKISGEVIGVKEALRRNSIDLALSVFALTARIVALSRIPDGEYYQLDRQEMALKLRELTPVWAKWEDVASNIWIWSEVVVMLFNEKKRALHDFLAGTVVIVLNPKKSKRTEKDLALEGLKEFKGFSDND
jgi:uncharacterized RDD family membrane protein YckC